MAGTKEDDGTFHGGFVREKVKGRPPLVVNTKPEDLHRLTPDGAMSRKEAGKKAKARKTKLAVMGLSAGILDAGDPRYAACVRLANALRKARIREMYEAHGYVSTGVSALLASSAMALASARFLYETAAGDNENRAQLLGQASKLSDSSRQNELSAWELCAREAVIRKRNDQNNVSSPWLTDHTGQEKRPRGRPRKLPMVALSQGVNTNAGDNAGATEETRQENNGDADGGATD